MTEAVRPKINFLSPELINHILDEALLLLEKQGIFVENEEAVQLFRQAGMQVEAASKKVFIKPELIQKCLDSTPSKIILYDRNGDQSYYLEGDLIHFNPGSTAVTILDHEARSRRKPQTRDLIHFVLVSDYLKNIDFQSTGLISGDVPDMIADSYRLFIGLQYSKKPVVTGTFRVEAFQPMLDMLTAVRGSREALREKPLAIFDACPSPPLKWSRLTSQSLIDAARAGIPSELISMGMTGATSPVTITGTLVQHVAENLCGLAICQLAQRGAPVIFGGSPSSFDMRKGTTPMGAIETMMIDASYAQIARHLGLPTHAYMGLSDAKTNDSQAGMESGIGAVLAALAGINVISGPGMLNFESCQSLEKLVIDNEICGMALRLVQGVVQRDDPIALELFEGLTPNAQFLSLPHTRKWYREEHIFPEILDRDTYDTWENEGKRSLADRAAQKVSEIIKTHDPPPLASDIIKELHAVMAQDAEANGLEKLPDLNDD
jgi:trimethylamine---corrinoid protein Co-methyltransferase